MQKANEKESDVDSLPNKTETKNNEKYNETQMSVETEEAKEINKDERTIQEVLLHEQLYEMGLQTDMQEKTRQETLSTEKLVDVLTEDSSEEDEHILQIDTNLDACRVNTGSILGKCIIDFTYFFGQLHEKFDEHCRGVQCSFRDLTFLGARSHGLRNELIFKCRMCNYESSIWSEPAPKEYLDANTGAVAGAILTGTGYTQLKENLSALDVKCMSGKTFRTLHEKIADGFAKAAEDSMNTAAEEERQLAIERNEVINEIPHISVIGDGSWMKRSYRTGRYDSLSGVGTICGARTGKVLHIAVRNKYCSVCVKAEKLKKQAPAHKCYKNWGRHCSSTSMEADAIVEGFKTSIEKRGLIYSTFIADGDSSVYKKIVTANPYQNVFIEKIECRNHLLRNLATKIKEIAKTKGRIGKLRNVIENRILRVRTAVTKAVQHRMGEETPMKEKILLLKKDLDNVISHVFGEHNDCARIGYFCNGSQKENEENYVPRLKMCGLYDKLQNALKQISWNAKSLLYDKDSNRVETFNSVISKCIGGKRINYGLRGSYEARCNAAVVAFNTGEAISRLSNALGVKAGENAINLEEENKAAKEKICNKEKRKQSYTCVKNASADKDYGPQAEKPDAEPAEMELRIALHIDMLRKWQNKRTIIEQETQEQAASGIWQYYRTKIITASHFGHICKMRPSTSCASRVRLIVYPQEMQVKAMQHGIEYEAVARKTIETALNISIKRCGLFIDAQIPFLGASPDGLIEQNGIVEIKCPFAARFLTPEDAIATNVSNLRAVYQNEKAEKMKRSHIYYYQMQGQLHITQREYCIFAIWTPLGLKMEKIVRDDTFWHENMEKKLTQFYEQCVLPEIIDPRRERNMPIRDPDYIMEAKKRKSEESEHLSNSKKVRNSNEMKSIT